MTMAGGLARAVGVSLGGTLTLAGGATKQVARVLRATLSMTGGLGRSVRISVASTLSLSGALATLIPHQGLAIAGIRSGERTTAGRRQWLTCACPQSRPPCYYWQRAIKATRRWWLMIQTGWPVALAADDQAAQPVPLEAEP